LSGSTGPLTFVALAIVAGVVLGPALGARFVLVDDHEILTLAGPIGTPPSARSLDPRGLAFGEDPSVGRFRPLYWTIRYGEVALLGDNPTAWHALILAMGVIAAWLLAGAARALGASVWLALLFGAGVLVAPGVSSLWVRLGADDTVATLFLALSLWAAARASTGRQHARAWDTLFVVAAAASMLSKEAFALAAIGVGVFRAALAYRQSPALSLAPVPAAAWLVAGLGVLDVATVAVIGAASGPLGYGGRYFTLPAPGTYLRYLAQNSVILVYVTSAWIALLVIGATWTRLNVPTRRCLAVATLVAATLVVPQVLLYSQQGTFEGKYEAAGAIGLAAWAVAALVLVDRAGGERWVRPALGLWLAVLVLFGVSSWTYARSFATDSVELDDMLGSLVQTAPKSSLVAIAADPGRQYEPIQSLLAHIAHRDRGDLRVKVVALPSDQAYTALEANFAREVARSDLNQPPLSAADCSALGAVIVLGELSQAQAALPCPANAFRVLEFDNEVLLWGGDGVSLRPRLPGRARVGYTLLVPAGAGANGGA
jgi:hypothetical protein